MRGNKSPATMRMRILTLVLLVPAALEPQIMPPQPGRLNIYSQPAGASVYINGQKQSHPTNATFVVTPGNYRVSVSAANASFSCPEKQLTVNPGQTLNLTCYSSSRNWNP